MRLVDGEILIATLDRPDFERARRAIDGFAEWATYEDFQCDRDGWVIGLASAGHSARFTPVSLDHFLSWSACAGVAPTAERLNEFVELVEFFRSSSQSCVHGAPVAQVQWNAQDGGRPLLCPCRRFLLSGVARLSQESTVGNHSSTPMPVSFWSSGRKDRACPHSPTSRCPADHAERALT